MIWKGRERSGNVEDRRSGRGTKVAAGGGLIAVIFFLLQFFISGGNTQQLIGQVPQIIQMLQNNGVSSEINEEQLSQAQLNQLEFVQVVLKDTEDVWNKIFQENGLSYREPKFVLFKDATQSACGNAQTASGPFYCPSDEKIYMDMAFFDQLSKQFATNIGEFAIAYVIAHEVGHHVQHLLGVLDKTNQMQRGVSTTRANKIGVGVELQADFFAGVWANRIQKYKNILQEGDLEDALNAAATVGDDNIQKKTQGYVVPESFTHGSSAQRIKWFKKGYQTGDIRQGDTFSQEP